MEIIRNTKQSALFVIHNSKDDLLRKEEKDLLRLVTETLTIVYGGNHKGARRS
jgi:hypothetical protein